jgi:signal recognition particle subunit SEC65
MIQLNKNDLVQIAETLIHEYTIEYSDLIKMNMVHDISTREGCCVSNDIAEELSQIDFDPFDTKDKNYPKLIPVFEGYEKYKIVKRNESKDSKLPTIEEYRIDKTNLVSYYSGNGIPRHTKESEYNILKYMVNNGSNKISFSDMLKLTGNISRGILGNQFEPSIGDKSFVFNEERFKNLTSPEGAVIIERDIEPSTPALVDDTFQRHAGKRIQIDLNVVNKREVDLSYYAHRELLFNGKHVIFCPSSMKKEFDALNELVFKGIVQNIGMKYTKL